MSGWVRTECLSGAKSEKTLLASVEGAGRKGKQENQKQEMFKVSKFCSITTCIICFLFELDDSEGCTRPFCIARVTDLLTDRATKRNFYLFTISSRHQRLAPVAFHIFYSVSFLPCFFTLWSFTSS